MTHDIYHIVCLVNMEHERPKKAPLGITYVFSRRLLFEFTQSRAVSVHTWKVKRFNLAKVVSFVDYKVNLRKRKPFAFAMILQGNIS